MICSLLDHKKLIAAKASTLLMKETLNKSGHVICVYTRDYRNFDDVMKYHTILKEAGFNQQLFYKRDIDTMHPNLNQPEFFYSI